MKNPLRKRLLRELKSEIGKYTVIFMLMVLSIGVVSGFIVADDSAMKAYTDSFTVYNIEDGNFELAAKANKAQLKAIEENNIKVYEDFYNEFSIKDGSALRVYQIRQEVNKICLMEGQMPTATGQIAIDRMYAVNNEYKVGDVVSAGSKQWVITGLIAFPDYSCLFQNNNDSMFDSVLFGVGCVTSREFDTFSDDTIVYRYEWKYNSAPSDKLEEKDMAEELMKAVNKEVSLKSFVPQYQNNAITFTGEDMGSDRNMIIALLYIVIAILAFVFAITTSNTITKEATVIGTLRATGYTRKELVTHYMSMPLVVTLFSALIGNILGYTIIEDICVSIYYSSYSLTTYVTVPNLQAFLLTTVVPVVIMICINLIILNSKLKLSPLKFLRRDLSRKKPKKSAKLPSRLPFITRFGIRVIIQNKSNYIMLFVGVLFANLLLMFGLIFPSILNHYEAVLGDNLIAPHQYMLNLPISAVNEDKKLESAIRMMQFRAGVETENETAEKFSAYQLIYSTPKYGNESVVLYGINKDSRFVHKNFTSSDVYISSAYAQKFNVEKGDIITLKEEYEDKEYSFRVTGVYDYEGAICIFMDIDMLNKYFDLGKGYFCGYFSLSEIEDIPQEYMGTQINYETLTKISRQLTVSMGSMMNLVNAFAVIMFAILIYLLSKIIIEKNAQSISMAKVLGYNDREISKLYIFPTSVLTVIFLLLSLPIETKFMKWMFTDYLLTQISGWLPFYMDTMIYVKMMLMGVGTYIVVAIFEYRKLKSVAMNEALKNIE